MEIISTYNNLQDELNKAKENLKGVDENIKKFLGRDPNEMITPTPKIGIKRTVSNPQGDEPSRGRSRAMLPTGRRREFGGPRVEEDGPPPSKRRPGDGNVFSRLSGPVRSHREVVDSGGEEEEFGSKQLQSQVFATPGVVVSRQEVLHAQNPDEKAKARNRRMFGALLGTLQKFQQEETKMKEKEDKRAKVELKLEEAARQEKEQMRVEKTALFAERKRKQADIKKIEYKLRRMKEQEDWEAKQQLLVNYIRTRASPSIFYLPKSHTDKSLLLLAATREYVDKIVEKKREQLQKELEGNENPRRWQQQQEREERGREGGRRQGWREGRRRERGEGSRRHSAPSAEKSKPKEDLPVDDDSDLEGHAGLELDPDHTEAPGKEEGEEGTAQGEQGATPAAGEPAGEGGEDPLQLPGPPEAGEEAEGASSMTVDEKEFEPVYD